MSINSVILSRRRELGLTQEQVAQYLGVTAPAVNKWEKGITCPDLSLLPALARLLQTDPNTLLGFQKSLSPAEVAALTEKTAACARENGIDAGFAMAEEQIREYPNCAALIHQIALTLEGTMIFSGEPEVRTRYERKLLDWYERAARGDDEKIRNHASFMLAYKYLWQKKYEKAQEMMDLLPERSGINKNVLQSDLLVQKGQAAEAAKLLEKEVLQNINEQQMLLLKLLDAELAAEEPETAAQIAEISAKTARLFGLWDYNSHVALLETAVAAKDVRESIRMFRLLLDSLFSPWQMDASPLFKRLSDRCASSPDHFQKMLPPLLADLETNPNYEFLRRDREFQAMLAQYRRRLSAEPG